MRAGRLQQGRQPPRLTVELGEAIFSTPLTARGKADEIQTETIYEKGRFGKEKPKQVTKVVKVPKGDLEPVPFKINWLLYPLCQIQVNQPFYLVIPSLPAE